MVEKLNIAFYCREFPAYSETFIYKKAQNLLEAGHNLHIYCKIYNKKNLKANLDTDQWTGRIHVLPSKYNLLLFFYYFLLFFFRFNTFNHWKKIYKEFIKKDAYPLLYKVQALSHLCIISNAQWDIIHTHFLRNVDCFAIFPALDKTPLICSVLGGDASIDPYQGEKAFTTFQRRVRRCDGLIYSSSHLHKLVNAEIKPSATEKVIYPEFDSRLFIPKIRKKTHTPCRLVTVGRLHWAKGYPYALIAVRYLLNMDIEVEYRIAGEGESREEIEFLIRQMGLTSNVFLLGALDQNKIASLMSWADIYLGMSSKEEFGVVFLEAEASGVPIVATKLGGIPESTSENKTSLLVPRGDWAAAAEAIIRLIDKPGLYESMSKYGPEYSKQFDPNIITSQLISFYEKTLHKKKEPKK